MNLLLLILLFPVAIALKEEFSEEFLARKEKQFAYQDTVSRTIRCTKRHRMYVHDDCERRSMKLYSKMKNTPVTPESLPKFEKTCSKLNRCFFSLSCNRNQTIATAGTELEKFCGLEVYMQTTFAECAKKLSDIGSSCYQRWAPFPVVFTRNFEAKDKKSEYEKLRYACRRYFGEDLCMETEVQKACGYDQWFKFKVQLMGINRYLLDCLIFPYRTRILIDEKPLVPEDEDE